MSTGKLGVTLANFLSEAGHEAGRQVQPCSDTQALCETLLEWLCSPMSTPAGSASLQTA